jgi:hypothetical protein
MHEMLGADATQRRVAVCRQQGLQLDRRAAVGLAQLIGKLHQARIASCLQRGKLLAEQRRTLTRQSVA